MTITQKVQSFFQEVWTEMRKVSWLSRKETLQYTILVLAVTFVVAAFLGGLDYIFTAVIKTIVL